MQTDNTAIAYERKLKTACCLLLFGVMLTIFTVKAGLSGGSPFLLSCLFGVGVSSFCIGLFEFVKFFGLLEGFKRFLDLFRRDTCGLIYQIVAFVVGLVVMVVAWFAVAWPADVIYNVMSGMYTFSGVELVAVNFARGLISLLLGIGVFFLIIWVWVSAHRKEGNFF
jgi:hypothetical protein